MRQQDALDRQFHSPIAEPIAIIGIGCRFPGDANSPAELWQMLRDGRNAVSEVPKERWDIDAFYDPDPDAPGKMYTRYGGFIRDIGKFDAQFFGISPREAIRMDPQQRLLAEVAWEAVEHAGIAMDALAGSQTAVFIGLMHKNEYAQLQLKVGDTTCLDDPYYGLGTSASVASGRLSYLFDFKGPSITIDTGCSSSLVSVHLACRSLREHECNMALVGGVSAILLPENIINDCKMRMLAADGRCKTFDTQADGYVPGEGCGVVVLKRFSDAVRDGDTILALIRGSAVNQDGHSNGIQAPDQAAQEALLHTALAQAGLAPHQLGYIEAHGSGTSLGDRTEAGALGHALGQERSLAQPLIVGTIKTCIGHLTGAAGIAGLIKTVLVLQHKEIPPHLHLTERNPQISSEIEIPTQPMHWVAGEEKHLAGVNSFGWSGTNAHVILEEAPVRVAPAAEVSESSRRWYLLTLSAKTETALKMVQDNLVTHLKQHPQQKLADIAYTYQIGRSALNQRCALVCQDSEDALATLIKHDPRCLLAGSPQTKEHSLVFMFPGLGDHYVNMARQLYEGEQVFRNCVDHCATILKTHLGLDLRSILYPEEQPATLENPALSVEIQQNVDLRRMLKRGDAKMSATEHEQALSQTIIAQPALFVIDYALAQLWRSWGIQPDAMIGYSLGEYVAACLADVLSLEDALLLVAKRAQMIQALPAGSMLAIALPEKDVRALLPVDLSIAALNSAMMTVVAGPPSAIADLERSLLDREVACSRLQTSHAFHSTMMRPIEHALTELVQTISLHPPRIPYISNVTGTWITPQEATDASYWARHLCQSVCFADGAQALWQQQGCIMLEVGPGQMLGSLVLQHAASKDAAERIVLPSLRHEYDRRADLQFLLHTLGQLWLAGVSIDWQAFYSDEQHERLLLPTYPFERQHYWVEGEHPAPFSTPSATLQSQHKRTDLADWFFEPIWKQSRSFLSSEMRVLSAQKQCWLVFVDTCALGEHLAAQLSQQGQDVTIVAVGSQFTCVSPGVYSINPRQQADYDTLIQHLQSHDKLPQQIVHLWNITPDVAVVINTKTLDSAQYRGFYSLLFLTQSLGNLRTKPAIQLTVLTSNLHHVIGNEQLSPEKATIIGPCKVIPTEYSHIKCRSVDIVTPTPGTQQATRVLQQMLQELSTDSAGAEAIAYRGNRRWVQSFEPLRLDHADWEKTPLREKGTYLITGGLGGLGLALAKHLAQTLQARLVLVGRSTLPERALWDQYVANSQDPLSSKIRQLQELETLGAELLIEQADVSNEEQMHAVVARARQRFGQIHGVIHTAGTPGEGLMQLKTPEKVASVFASKVTGVLVLDRVLQQQEQKLDFMLYYSSINAITGGLGEVDYCAANAFLDAFAHYKSSQCGVPTIAVNWSLWQWDAWQSALFASLPQGHSRIQQMRDEYGISFQEGNAAILRILASPQPQLLVLPQGFEQAVAQSTLLSSLDFLEEIDAVRPTGPAYARPHLRTSYVAPRNEAEQKIANIWQELLGIDKVGIHDQFFELGGNSLVGMLAISRLKKAFGVQLSAADLFEAPTVSALFQLIEPGQQETSVLEQSNSRGKLRRERQRRRG